MNGPVRELSFEDQATWGKCPVCEAPHGTWCHAAAGLQLGVKADGSRMKDGDGVHGVRLQNAPDHVQEVPVRGAP